jgi:hypothetical protein
MGRGKPPYTFVGLWGATWKCVFANAVGYDEESSRSRREGCEDPVTSEREVLRVRGEY